MTTTPAHSRALAALLAGGLVGLGVVVLAVLAGLVLYDRLWSGSSSILVAVYLTCLAAGGYGGWLAGVVTYSSIRRPR